MRIFIILLCVLSLNVYAGEAQDMAQDPVLEKRMVGLAEKLRCLVCQNESLASSHAELADDLRREVRELMQKGMSDQEIKDYLVARYGDFVLYEPPLKNFTLFLWLGPFVLLLGGMGLLIFKLRGRRKVGDAPNLSPEAQARATTLLNDEKR
jgi:cytochrome c-type biogenesis protein CcmH